MTTLTTTTIILFFAINVMAQNLVINPSFEELNDSVKLSYPASSWYYGSMESMNNMSYVVGWTSASEGTPDVYYCKTDKHAHSGKAMAFAALISSHKEYPQAQLTNALEEGKQYIVSMWLKAHKGSYQYPNVVGVKFSEKHVYKNHDNNLSLKPDIVWEEDELPKRHLVWVQVIDTFTAKGGEKYMIFGNFKSRLRSSSHEIRKGKGSAVPATLIDDVSVSPLIPEPIHKFDTIPFGKPFVIENVQFEFDDTVLLNSSYPNLNELADWLVENDKINLIIEGHTDDQGSDAYNKALSQKRALAVVNYLIYKGIAEKRLRSIGYGSTIPLAPNNTTENQALNRRVAFRVL